METESCTIHQLTEAAYAEEHPKPLPKLPQEIIGEILSWLPVKSLLKFRCVSRTWLSLISSPHFIKKHLKIQTCSGQYARHRLLLGPYPAPAKIYTCSLYSILFEKPLVDAVDLHFPLQDPCSKLSIVGCCNGLFCIIENSQSLVIWNPSTRKCKKLANVNADNGGSGYFVYGFGYDYSNDDYKVVRFHGDGFKFEAKVNVYSLRLDSWSKIQDYKGGNLAGEPGVFFNGALHWGVASYRYSNVWFIISFNIVEETYEEMALPHDLTGDNVGWSIGILEDYLSLFYYCYEVRTDVWVMKEYGVKKSWTKLYSIPYNDGFCSYVSPIVVKENGEILLLYGTRMVLYSPRDTSFKHCEIRTQLACAGTAAIAYFESLISPELGDIDWNLNQ